MSKNKWKKMFEALGVSQVEFSRIAGIHRSNMHKLLNKECGVSGQDEAMRRIVKEAQSRGIEFNVEDII